MRRACGKDGDDGGAWMRQVKGKRAKRRCNDLVEIYRKYMQGILASANYPMHTSVLEGEQQDQSDKAHGIWDARTQNTFF